MSSTRSTLAVVAATGLLLASKCEDEPAKAFAAAEVARWDSLAPEALDELWNEAQATTGVLAVEPYTSVIGAPAAKKKTWAVADGTLKFFSYGFEPIWFPADVVRRTVCGEDPRFSYFWHSLSGDESDLHPWLHGEKAFRDLLGDGGASVLGTTVNVAACSEVFGGAGNESCLYGEVSAPLGFDGWFCGGRGSACRGRLDASHTSAPAVFAAPDTLCMHGPFVLERVHGWRPEIHPAEVVWTRRARPRGEWTFALVPDTSERFDQTKDYDDRGQHVARSWKPWSSERPVELWVAFSSDGEGAGVRFDLARKLLGKTALPARQVTLEPPAPGAFAVLPSDLDGVVAAAKTWASGAGERGFLVVRTTLHRRASEAAVLRLRQRGADEPAQPPEIDGIARLPPAAPPEAAPVGRVRMLGEVRTEDAVIGTTSVNTLVRFDPRRPTVPADEEATDRLNEALKGTPAQRTAEFGKEHPFRVEWELQATRGTAAERVAVTLAAPAQLLGRAVPDRVRVTAFPGPATEEIRVKTDGAPIEAAPSERKPVSLGQLVLSVPREVTVVGVARVFYVGSKPLDLPEPAVVVSFRYPPWSYPKEWDLVKDVLGELDPTTADGRLTALRREACAPAPPEACESQLLASEVESRLLDPVARWEARRALASGRRPLARFVRLFARNLVWDGRVSNDERDTLKKLLKEAPLTPE
jgi:hypothetical protein